MNLTPQTQIQTINVDYICYSCGDIYTVSIPVEMDHEDNDILSTIKEHIKNGNIIVNEKGQTLDELVQDVVGWKINFYGNWICKNCVIRQRTKKYSDA